LHPRRNNPDKPAKQHAIREPEKQSVAALRENGSDEIPSILCAGWFCTFPVRGTISIEECSHPHFSRRESISIEKSRRPSNPKPRRGFIFVDVFRIDSIDMNALTGKVHM
jgi:hypothetical protein